MARLNVLVAVLGLRVASAHPCETEIASACPDTPGTEMAKCLTNSEEHETKIALSSECTDFMALNKACADDIMKSCDENFYSDDTILCLTKWTDKESLAPKCQSVLKWAVPRADDEAEVITDELGMSQKDIDEKEEWRAKRKAARGDAIERMKMKEADRKKEEDRVALEEFKKTDPDGYAQMMEQQAEEKRQQAEIKRLERKRVAALERKRQQEQGVEDEDVKPQKAKKTKAKVAPYPWYVPYAAMLAIGGVAYAGWVLKKGGGSKRGGGNKGKKKR